MISRFLIQTFIGFIMVAVAVLIGNSSAAPINVKKANCVEYICMSNYKMCIGNIPAYDDFTKFQQESIICKQAKCLCNTNTCEIEKKDKDCSF